jgi:hypothetical protein
MIAKLRDFPTQKFQFQILLVQVQKLRKDAQTQKLCLTPIPTIPPKR